MEKLFLTIMLMFVAVPALAQVKDDADKTGTNPVNFTHDFRVYNEFTWLKARDSHQNVTTAEFRKPFADGKWQFRTRARHTSVDLDANGDGIDEVNKGGLGEVDFRFITVPYMNMEEKVAVAVGLETFLPTAEEGLGSKRLSFGPQVFGVFFTPFGIKGSLIAPAYQHKFSVYEASNNDDLHQGLFDLFILKQSDDKQKYALLNPSYIVDYNEGTSFGIIDAEMGMIVDKWTGSQGHSIYVRPGTQFSSDRLADASIEVGYKIVW